MVIVIGLALFAFIAGDAWRVIQPHQSHDVGEIYGKALSYQDYQKMVEEYTEVIKFSNGLTSLTDEQATQVRDEVWRSYVNNKLVEAEAAKIGLEVTDEEIQAIIDAGSNPMLQNSPFRNQQTGAFDKDMLKKVLADYAKMDPKTTPAQYYEYYTQLAHFWTFLEKNLRQNRLAEKYQALLNKAIESNPVEAQANFDARVNQSDLLLAAIPYSSIPDSLIKVKESEVKDLYNKRKEQYKQPVETRDIKYIDVQITPSTADRENIEKEVTDYTHQLAEATSDYAGVVRASGSSEQYTDLYFRKEAFPADVVARLDSVSTGSVFGPYFNAADNSFNSFRKLSVVTAPDSIQYRQIQVYNEDMAKTRVLADSIFNALKGGAKFEDLAERYHQEGTSVWMSSANYENTQIDSDNMKYISALTSMAKNDIRNVEVGVANVILQVVDTKAVKDKYKIAVIKRPVIFSTETYNKAYNQFSQFVAGNPTLDELSKNAEDAGYRLLERNELYSSEHGIGGIKGTSAALRWAFSAKPGDVSTLYEAGDNDRLLVVALEGINPEGYRPVKSVQTELWREVAKDKKAEKILADMKAANATTIEQYKAMPNAVSDTVKLVTFSAPAYVSVLRSSEPLVGAYASIAEMNKLSQPIKGNSGVMVMQVYAQEKLNETYSEETEKETIKNMHQRMLSRFINDLYQNANVKDNRYLFF